MIGSLETGFLLDRRWHWMRGEMERSKEPDLALLTRLLREAGISYAIIGGVALQLHLKEPRTTIDVDVAVERRDALPRDLLLAHGFRETGRYPHSENWIGPEGTPVQFTDDPALAGALRRAMDVSLRVGSLRVLQAVALLHEKMRAGGDPARRRSKRLQDLADAQALIEQDPGLAAELTPEEKRLLDELPR